LELVCDRIVILDHGRVLHEGKISDITVRPETEIQLVLVGEEETIRRALGNRLIVEWLIMGEEQFEVTLPAPTQQYADELIDDLRRHGVSLISMSRSRMTLEQAFLSIIAAARENS
jgi:ABC-type multidrug transport system ATPase subunit